MKKALKILKGSAAAAAVAIMVQGLGTIAAGPSADAVDGVVTTTTRVHVRTSPSTAGASLSVLNKGQQLTSLGSSNGWTKVSYRGKTAYVASAYLSTAASPARTTSRGSTATTYATAFLNLRTGASLKSPVKLIVAKGTALKLTGAVSGDYSQVVYQGSKLWAATRYLATSKTPSSATAATTTAYTSSNLNLRTSASRSARVAVVAKRGTAVRLTGKTSGEFSQLTYNGKTLWGATRYLTSSPTASSAKTTTKYTTSALHLRTGPATTRQSAGIVPKATALRLTGTVSGDFSQVTHNGKKLWAATRYLTSAAAAAPAASKAPATTTKYASAEMHVWTSSSGQAHVSVLPAGSSIAVTGVVKSGRTQVVYQGALRWVTSKLVSATAPKLGASLNRGYSKGLEKTNKNVQAIAADVWTRFPQIKTQYGWRQSTTPDHPAGRAVDVMIPSYKSNQALGWRIANYYRANAKKYNINYIIFGQKIWHINRDSQGWRPMADRGGDTANHYDHVHINTFG